MKKHKPNYTTEPAEEGWAFDETKVLSKAQEKSMGIPSPAAAKTMRLIRKPARINIRTTHETIAGLRARAEEAGMPYQTLAASILHMVAKGELKLSLVGSDEVKRQGSYGAARRSKTSTGKKNGEGL
jgi:predicted DNA binding CopG/RHH family protein